MVDHGAVTLASLFLTDSGEGDADRFAQLAQDEQTLAVKTKIAGVPGLSWDSVSGEIREQTAKLLDVGLDEIIFGAWKKLGDLQKYRDKKKYPPDETILAPLAEHEIKSSHDPYIEVLVNDKPVGRITFSINVALNLQGVVLKIRDGKIWEVKSGKCQCRGTLKCGDQVLFDKKLLNVDLPAVITLREGFPIPGEPQPSR
jgi:hypothetical protein